VSGPGERGGLEALAGTGLSLLKVSTLLARYAASAALPTHPNPLTRFGGKIYSQNDEDGITFEILRRLRLERGVFAEFGVGKGLENNTLALIAAGWPGFWVGCEELAVNPNPRNAQRLNFCYQKAWVRASNIRQLHDRGLEQIRQRRCDVVSLDLDGNDWYFVQALLESGVCPGLFIVEYNAKFMPPIRFKIEYDDDHRWMGDDYFGASLCSFVDLFARHDYFLACCNLTGANAFFVRGEFREAFVDVPRETERLYASAKYFLTGLDYPGHPPSLRTIEMLFQALNSGRDVI
jgi:hypothetical protein